MSEALTLAERLNASGHVLQKLAAHGDGYFAQSDIKRLDRSADVAFEAAARIAELERELAELSPLTEG